MADITEWIGREERHEDVLRVQPARFMQAVLDRAPDLEAGDPLPPLWHWLYFLDAKRAGELGRDGHPKKGGFLPPVDLPRRMWAGGRFTFRAPLMLGAEAAKRSFIKSIEEKQGRSGRLCFVTVCHEITQGGALALSEEHDIVYREDPGPNAAPPEPFPAPGNPVFSETVLPDETLLFRYSALTFNGHRIHYDADYSRRVEGYEGLVFHGPLTATLLVDLATRQAGKAPQSFEFRALAPLAGLHLFHIEGQLQPGMADLWARRHDGALAMRARAAF